MAELSRPQMERFLNAGNVEAFIDAVAEHFPGTPGTPTRKAYVSSVRVYLRWAQEERRSVLNAAGDTAGAYVASLQAAGSSSVSTSAPRTSIRSTGQRSTISSNRARCASSSGPSRPIRRRFMRWTLSSFFMHPSREKLSNTAAW